MAKKEKTKQKDTVSKRLIRASKDVKELLNETEPLEAGLTPFEEEMVRIMKGKPVKGRKI